MHILTKREVLERMKRPNPTNPLCLPDINILPFKPNFLTENGYSLHASFVYNYNGLRITNKQDIAKEFCAFLGPNIRYLIQAFDKMVVFNLALMFDSEILPNNSDIFHQDGKIFFDFKPDCPMLITPDTEIAQVRFVEMEQVKENFKEQQSNQNLNINMQKYPNRPKRSR